MSKPSGTNSPRASIQENEADTQKRIKQMKREVPDDRLLSVSLSLIYAAERSAVKVNGGNSSGDPPLPIPNREVKPARAHDTAIPSGKVGSRQLTEALRDQMIAKSFFYSFTCFARRGTLPPVAEID